MTKRTPSPWATLAMEAIRKAFGAQVPSSIQEKEMAMALAIDDRFAGVVNYCRRQREIYGPDSHLDAALAAIDN